jgi:hypothetical protein
MSWCSKPASLRCIIYDHAEEVSKNDIEFFCGGEGKWPCPSYVGGEKS